MDSAPRRSPMLSSGLRLLRRDAAQTPRFFQLFLEQLMYRRIGGSTALESGLAVTAAISKLGHTYPPSRSAHRELRAPSYATYQSDHFPTMLMRSAYSAVWLATSSTRPSLRASAVIAFCLLTGCGATKSYIATEQLLLSDAVDSSVEQIDFTPLAGRRVYLDRDSVPAVRGTAGGGLVAWEYIISSVREQMVLAGCLLAPDRESAEIIAEVRVGAMGTDGHSLVVGIPATNNSSGNPAVGQSLIPTLPELSVAKRESMSGAAKIAVHAYLRDSREVVWQSGTAHADSQASDTWFMGAGPFQRGSIHEHDKPSERATVSTAQGASVIADQAKHRTPQVADRKTPTNTQR